MFLGYPLSNWIEVVEYSVFVLMLFIGICLLSVKLDKLFFGNIENNNKIYKISENKKKQIFHDVA